MRVTRFDTRLLKSMYIVALKIFSFQFFSTFSGNLRYVNLIYIICQMIIFLYPTPLMVQELWVFKHHLERLEIYPAFLTTKTRISESLQICPPVCPCVVVLQAKNLEIFWWNLIYDMLWTHAIVNGSDWFTFTTICHTKSYFEKSLHERKLQYSKFFDKIR